MPTILQAPDGTFLTFDSTTSVRVVAADSVTRHPTERGVVITDHVQREPLIVSILGMVTESPLEQQVLSGGVTRGLDGETRVRTALDWLDLQRGKRLSLSTDGLDDLDDLVIIRLPNEVTAQRLRVLALELQQVLVATVEYVDIPPELPPARRAHAVSTAVDLGEQATQTEPVGETRNVSAAVLVRDYVNGLFGS